MDDRISISNVTGTDLELRVAGPGGRSYAFIVDWHIRLLVAAAWFIAASLLYSGTAAWFDGDIGTPTDYFYLVALPSLVLYFFYHPVLEILMDGRTPGKRIAGIRVVTQDGQAPSLGAHLIRNVFRLIDSLPFTYVIGFITTLVSERNLRFGDMAAGTLLIYDSADESSAEKEIDVIQGTQFGLKETELVQELVARWNSLDSGARIEMGRQLLARMGFALPPSSNDDQLLAQLKAHLK